ncbi:MAG: hemerythrin domain-containing protein [Ignavibacteriales bacterium]|nr:hemerythrin domain-containing protein [Ignavibacteriales bacterium]
MQFHNPIEVLTMEHEEGLYFLEQLHTAAQYIGSSGFSFDAFLKLADAIRFIDNELRAHNEKEEKYLFPLLERHAGNPTRVLIEEHRELWKVFARIRQCVEDVEEGRIYATTVKELVQTSELLYELLKNHISKENEVLFPMVKNVLSSEEYEQLTENIIRSSTPPAL